MKSSKFHILFSLILIFVLTLSASSVSFAEKPIAEFEIEITNTTSDSVTLHYSWNNFSGYRITASVIQYVYVNGTLTQTSYIIGNASEQLEKVTREVEDGELIIPLVEYNPIYPLSGSQGRINCILYNRNGSRAMSVPYEFFPIP